MAAILEILTRVIVKVGVLDVDLCGPSIPKMFSIEKGVIHQLDNGWLPVYVDPEQRLGVMSIGFLLASSSDVRNHPVVVLYLV